MPKLGKFGYILDYLYELGVVSEGVTPLSFVEIKAWQDLMFIELSPFETTLIHSLSCAYCGMWYAAKKEIPAPYVSDKDLNKINTLAQDSFRRMAKT